MAKRRTIAELEETAQHYASLWLLGVWAIRQTACLPGDTYVVIRRPPGAIGGSLVVRTDDWGVPQYSIDPSDSSRVAQEFRVTKSDDRLRLDLTSALLEAREDRSLDVGLTEPKETSTQ